MNNTHFIFSTISKIVSFIR